MSQQSTLKTLTQVSQELQVISIKHACTKHECNTGNGKEHIMLTKSLNG